MGQIAAFFDIDGTLTSHNVWRGIMEFFIRRRERMVTHWVFSALHYPLLVPRALRLLPESAFRRWWTLHLPWYFRGFDEARMHTLAEWVAHEYTTRIVREDVLAVLRGHLERGQVVALVSGAPTPFAQAIAEMWKVPHAIGSPVEMRAGRYTGRMSEPCIDEHKAVYARQYFSERRIEVDYAASYAYADSYSDMGLFEMVGNPVAVYPDERLSEVAQVRGWAVIAAHG